MVATVIVVFECRDHYLRLSACLSASTGAVVAWRGDSALLLLLLLLLLLHRRGLSSVLCIVP